MAPADAWFVALILTVLLTRILLYVWPTPSPTVMGFRLHHYMYGLLLAPLGIIFDSTLVYGAGIGLVLDEVPYLLLRGQTHADNYSWPSLAGVLLLVVLAFLLRSAAVAILPA